MRSSSLRLELWDGPEFDWPALTSLLHRAYRPLAERGMRYYATHQPPDVTQRRGLRGECYVAFWNDELAGTITFEDAATTKGCLFYDRSDTASFHQFGVEPRLQTLGIGLALLARAEQRARETGAVWFALDTADTANHLIAWYTRLGFEEVGEADWEATNYRSLILAKRL